MYFALSFPPPHTPLSRSKCNNIKSYLVFGIRQLHSSATEKLKWCGDCPKYRGLIKRNMKPHSLVGGWWRLEGWCKGGPSTSMGRGFVICSRSIAAIPESVSGTVGISPHNPDILPLSNRLRRKWAFKIETRVSTSGK